LGLWGGKTLELPEAKYLCSQVDIRNPHCLQAGIGYLPNNKPTSLPLCGSLARTWTPARLSKPW